MSFKKNWRWLCEKKSISKIIKKSSYSPSVSNLPSYIHVYRIGNYFQCVLFSLSILLFHFLLLFIFRIANSLISVSLSISCMLDLILKRNKREEKGVECLAIFWIIYILFLLWSLGAKFLLLSGAKLFLPWRKQSFKVSAN